MQTRIILGLSLALGLLHVAGCPTNAGPILNPDDVVTDCQNSDECGAGLVCQSGACAVGSCDPALELQCDGGELSDSPYCCKAWELCSTLSLQCARDPDVTGVGCPPNEPDCVPCAVDTDCPKAGQFCSGARCFDAAGRADCTSSFQCPGGERCDRTVFLCVPDQGGCTFCGSFPELCCEEGSLCSEETGFCVDVADPECEVEADCAPGTFCDSLQRCVQCDDDTDCGPGLLCNEGTGDCFSEASQCTSDDDCLGNKRCAIALQTCVVPDCEADGDCDDSRERCNLESFQCFLPPAVCTEGDEPNQATTQATALTNSSYSGLLCRGDTDVLSFPVIPAKRYTATVDFGGSGQAGITVAMLNPEGAIESSATFTSTQASVQVVGVTGESESGTFYVRVVGGNIDDDQWSYTVTVREDEPSAPADCSPAGQTEEPNATGAQATVLTAGTRAFGRCGTDDVDFYKITVQPLHGVRVTLSGFYNAEGNMNLDLYKDVAGTQSADNSRTVNDVEVVDGPEGVVDYYLKVSLGSPSGAVSDQRYSVTVEEIARPSPECDEPGEDDGQVAGAQVLTLVGSPPSLILNTPVRCNPQDVDLFRFTMPANLGGVVQLSFNHNEGNMALDLLSADGATQLATSNVSTAASEPDEQVDVPGSTSPIDYLARVRLVNPPGTNIVGQHYELRVNTFDNAQCIASEPSGDNSFGTGRCIGSWTPDTTMPCVNESTRIAEPLDPGSLATCGAAAPGTPGCGLTCGNGDDDWYRVGPMANNQVLRATLTYDPAGGLLSLVRGDLTINGSSDTITEGSTLDSDGDGLVVLSYTATGTTAKEYGVKVKPQGTTGHQLEPYALKIEVGLPCADDGEDAGSAANELPSTSTIIRDNPVLGSPFTVNTATLITPTSSRCTNDVDVYEFIAYSGEDVTVTLNQTDPSPGGMVAELYPRPDVLTQLPPAGSLIGTATHGAPYTLTNNPSTRQLFVVVKAPSGVAVTGPYSLVVSTTP